MHMREYMVHLYLFGRKPDAKLPNKEQRMEATKKTKIIDLETGKVVKVCKDWETARRECAKLNIHYGATRYAKENGIAN